MAGDVQADDDAEIVMSFEPPEPKQPRPSEQQPPPKKRDETTEVEFDEFGLPVKRPQQIRYDVDDEDDEDDENGRDNRGVEEKPATKALPEKQEREETAGPAAVTPVASTSTPPAAATPPANSDADSKPGPDDKRASLMSLSESDRKNNELRMFSEDPKDPHMASGVRAVSEWSHQQQVPLEKGKSDKDDDSDGEWQAMPAYASHDIYDDYGRLIAKAHEESDEDGPNNGASKGYTRVYDDEDAESATSMDEHTQYLFKEDENDDASRNPLSQMQATKELLTEGQRVAYVGVCRLAMLEMTKDLEQLDAKSRSMKKALGVAVESMKMWSQKMMVRLYTHMEISPPEQVMIEQLAEHGVLPSDLTPSLMQNARVKNPMAPAMNRSRSSLSAPGTPNMGRRSSTSSSFADPPPPYEETANEEPGEVRTPSQLPESKTLDIDIRWTVLCDLFLVLIADSVYDARSRTLLERVGAMMEVPWLEIYKFEKRVTDALEMQESTEQNWTEKEHLENRQKQARNKRYMMLGLATVGGSLVIGLSGGLLAPVIGAGLAAGFTTIGVAGTSGFLAGVGGTALIATGATVTGGVVGGKAGWNRTKAVQTFEFRPLHNAKRVNLIITISGWMNGKVDDVRLPFSTVDPIMGDLFSVYWEPEMLQSTGQTINILATEVLTQSLQQVLGSTILTALMASIQLPVLLTKLSYLLDNPWSVSLDRAWAAGLILADSLMHRNLGVRPVTLVGYSLGARVIYSCLQELAKHSAYGLVQNVYLFGSPVVVKKDEYTQAKAVVPGRFVNCYSTNDWILGYLFRATSGGIGRVAGLAPVEDVPGVENVDCTSIVKGHMDYRGAIPRLLRHVGWEVTSDEFTEIEDPDPDNHQARQRELINELDEARKELEKEPEKKKRFTFFGRKNAGKKQEWETYQAGSKPSTPRPRAGSYAYSTDDGYDDDAKSFHYEGSGNNEGVLFDIDAIRAELAKDGGQEVGVHELETTLPAMKLDPVSSPPMSPPQGTGLKPSKSFSDLVNGTGNSSNSRSGKPRSEYDALPAYEEELHMEFEPDYDNGRGGFDSGSRAYGGYDTAAGGRDRPEFRSSQTAPAGMLAGGGMGAPERNVWLDDDEDEFAPKGDGEMTMTFA